jgi:DNA-binding transcriptional ArsR family regulator
MVIKPHELTSRQMEMKSVIKRQGNSSIIVQLLLHGGEPLTRRWIQEHTHQSQSSVTHHLLDLIDHGVLVCERGGKAWLYRLNPDEKRNLDVVLPEIWPALFEQENNHE